MQCPGRSAGTIQKRKRVRGAESMEPKTRTNAELRKIARDILESLRPQCLSVGQIQIIAEHMADLTNNIILREIKEE